MPVKYENGVLHLYGELGDALPRRQVRASTRRPGPKAIRSIVTVGEGRGFVVEGSRRYIITCPRPHMIMSRERLPVHYGPTGRQALVSRRLPSRCIASVRLTAVQAASGG
jgi:hypothetical protein